MTSKTALVLEAVVAGASTSAAIAAATGIDRATVSRRLNLLGEMGKIEPAGFAAGRPAAYRWKLAALRKRPWASFGDNSTR
jgi:DNA-binding IclR family transcriptional regulator